MFGPFTAASLTTLTLLVAVVVSPLTAQESQEPFGIYDDWSVHRLQDGDLRVCYAETRLVSSQSDCGFWGAYDRVTKNVVEWHQTALNRLNSR